MNHARDDLQPLVEEILQSRKYRGLDIPQSTVEDLLLREIPRYRNIRQAVDATRKKLHNIVAPYLGDPDYADAIQRLQEMPDGCSDAALRPFCAELLGSHASTRERLALLDDFYARLFTLTGLPQVILDLACGLNPLAFPWMGLPPTTRYYAYDIHQPRLNLINAYFHRQGLAPLALHQDILLEPPQVEGDVAFLFKEAHRLEQRLPGCNRSLWKGLRVRWLLVSLPAYSLTGRHSLLAQHRRLVQNSISGEDWQVTEIRAGDEVVFCIDQSNQLR